MCVVPWRRCGASGPPMSWGCCASDWVCGSERSRLGSARRCNRSALSPRNRTDRTRSGMHRIASLAFAVAAVGCKGSERPPTPITTKITLRYHPPAGAVYRYAMDQTALFGSDSGVDTMGLNGLRVAFTQTVGTAGTDGVPITFTFDSTTVDSPMLNPDAARQVVDKLKSTRFTTTYDDHLRPRADAQLPGLSPLVRDQLQAALQVAAPALPDQPVGIGDSWTNDMQLPVSGLGSPITVHTRLTVKDISVSRGDTIVR